MEIQPDQIQLLIDGLASIECEVHRLSIVNVSMMGLCTIMIILNIHAR